MPKFKTIARVAQLTFVFFFIIFCGPLFAENKGQIININQSYQIAFTDLGNNILKPGDIVKITINGDEFVYMQVLESSAILTKLGPSQLENFRTSLINFQNMAVGDEVVKIDHSQAKTDHPSAAALDPNDVVGLSQKKIQLLEKALALAREEIKHLEESNEESKKKLNELAAEDQAKKEVPQVPLQTENKEILGQVKAHLNNMHKLIEENN